MLLHVCVQDYWAILRSLKRSFVFNLSRKSPQTTLLSNPTLHTQAELMFGNTAGPRLRTNFPHEMLKAKY